MRISVLRRLAALEARLKPAHACDNLNAEIRAMTAPERSALRDYLQSLKNSNQPEEQTFAALKKNAEVAILAARQRLAAVNLS